jgi:hypothetical protein
LDEDPYGPETIYNLALASLKLAQNNRDAHAELGIRALWLCAERFPHFRPACERLGELRGLPGWLGTVNELEARVKKGGTSRHVELVDLVAELCQAGRGRYDAQQQE